MIAVDTNVLLHAHREELPKHEAARRRLKELAEGRGSWALPVFCIGEFLRVITHVKLFDPPHTAAEACEALDRMLASPTVAILSPGPAYPDYLTEAIKEADAVGNLVFDAQIAALCREWRVSTLLTEDRDFDRFSGLRTERIGE